MVEGRRRVGGWWRCFYPRPDRTDAFGDPKKNLPVADSSCCSRTLTGQVPSERSGVREVQARERRYCKVFLGIVSCGIPVKVLRWYSIPADQQKPTALQKQSAPITASPATALCGALGSG